MKILEVIKWYFKESEIKRRLIDTQKEEDEKYWLGRLENQEKKLTNNFNKKLKDQEIHYEKRIKTIAKGVDDELITMERNYLIELEKKDDKIHELQLKMIKHSEAYDSYKDSLAEYENCAQRLVIICQSQELQKIQNTQQANAIVGKLRALKQRLQRNEPKIKAMIDSNQEAIEIESIEK